MKAWRLISYLRYILGARSHTHLLGGWFRPELSRLLFRFKCSNILRLCARVLCITPQIPSVCLCGVEHEQTLSKTHSESLAKTETTNSNINSAASGKTERMCVKVVHSYSFFQFLLGCISSPYTLRCFSTLVERHEAPIHRPFFWLRTFVAGALSATFFNG
jgi:hypothetical protein